MTWIHHSPEWPEFTWDDATLGPPLAGVRHKQGRHLGKMEALGFDLRTEAQVSVLTDEVVRSSAIEGEHLDPALVRSSLARQLGLDAAGLPALGRDVEGVVTMLLDATRNFDRPLTAERLFGWHAALWLARGAVSDGIQRPEPDYRGSLAYGRDRTDAGRVGTAGPGEGTLSGIRRSADRA